MASPDNARVVVVVGNPKPRSRTLTIAEAVGVRVAATVGFDPEGDVRVIDLVELAGSLFDYSSPAVNEAKAAVRSASVLVVASPTYKATYTGLLKSFLDWFSQTDLEGIVAVPVMVGAGARHAMSVEVFLRPLLVEIGATVAARGLYVIEDELDSLPEAIETWLEPARTALRRAVGDHPAAAPTAG